MDREQAAGQAVPAPGADPPTDFQTFMEANYRDFLKSLMCIGADQKDAEDTIGDVILHIVRKNLWHTLANPKAWIRTAVLHIFYDRRQRERERPRREIKGCHLTADSYVDQGLNVWEDGEWVRQMLDTLTKTQREVVEQVLRDLKPSEIAELLGKSPEAIRQHLSQARTRLKANLGKDYRIDPVSRLAPTPRKEVTP